ncbi:hypothetical protein [Bradyrhizobium sp.]|uniref:hypothetical protein n=1 Tax=Bradyrhizobium sp. TaxID=376 RepID=UPI003BB0D775
MSEMSDDELTTAEAKPLPPLQILFVKVAIITAAIIAVLYCASYFFESFIASKAEQLTFLKGGPAFWRRIETKLYSLADEPDLPPEKKKKIVDALHKLSIKYKPYVDTLSGNDAPAPAKNR